MKSMYKWLGKHVHAPYGTYILSLLTLIEGFFVVPISTLLAFYCLENRRKSFFYATITTVTSGAGALLGYYVGTLLWQFLGQNVINWIISPESFNYLVEQYQNNQAWAVTTLALTPLPFKALTLTAGFCRLPVVPFVCFTMLGRGIRFYLIATGIYFWGNRIQYYLDRYFYYFVALAISIFFAMWWLLH
jgi:membrane protein YqaA with SNARE-associated domain